MLTRRCKETLYSDSEYLVNSMTKGWAQTWKKKNWWRKRTQRVLNFDLWQKLLPLCEKHQVEFRWVRGHAGNQENERCDVLSMEALRKPDLPVDEGYENKADGIRPELQEGEPCPKCSMPIIKQPGTKKPNRDWYWEYFLWCPKCKQRYDVESAKRAVEQPRSLFEE
jgi:ribonuclease HI